MFRNSFETSHVREFTNIQINDEKTELKDARDLPTSKRQTHSVSTPSIWKLIKLNKPEWPYAVLGSVGAVLAGMQAPLFALGITHVLTAFYSYDNQHIKHEVGKIALIFVGAAVVAIPIYLLQHYFYTLMGERLTTRVRLSMFSGFFFTLASLSHFNLEACLFLTWKKQIKKLSVIIITRTVTKHTVSFN